MDSLSTKHVCILLNILIFVFCSTTINAQDAKARLYDLYDEVEEYEDSLRSLDDKTAFSAFSTAEREAQYQYRKEMLERLSKIDQGELEWGDRVSYDLFERDLLREIQDHEIADYLVPINHEGGFHTRVVGRANSTDPESVEEYEEYIARLKSVPEYFEGNMDLMREGLATGHTLPKKVLTDDYKVMMTSQIVNDPTQSDFYKPFQEFPTSISQGDRQRLREEGWNAIQEAVIPAYRDFLEFMEEEYMPGARESIAITELPGGEKYYNFLVQYYTTLNLSPKEIHEIGLDEVNRIRSEMEAIIKEVNFEGTFDEFLEFLRTDPRFYVEEPEQLLKEATYIAKRMDGQLPRLFNMMPRKPYGVEPVPAHLAPRYTGGRYSPADGETDAGNYWVNTYDLDSRPLYTLEALTFHEAVPGHHLQIALAKELDLPEIRREAGVTAFVEGWALYAERLGLEAGFYQDPYSNFGRLTYEMWRACRLVVDTGMHALGWSRERAVQFMTENTALSHHEINTEINRYIAVPGQALAYKMGELKIRELREKAEQELGDRFDVRKFHDAVLLSGPVPLTALEQNIKDYIEKTKNKAEKEDDA